MKRTVIGTGEIVLTDVGSIGHLADLMWRSLSIYLYQHLRFLLLVYFPSHRIDIPANHGARILQHHGCPSAWL